MKHISPFLFLFFVILVGCKSQKKEETETLDETEEKNVSEKQESNIVIDPILHASAIIQWKEKTIYIDPSGGAKAFEGKKAADIVLITDIHGDHMDIDTLDSLDISKAVIVVPQAVGEKLPAGYTGQLVIINNGETKNVQDIAIEAVLIP